MATMVKKKRRQKNKSKEKNEPGSSHLDEDQLLSDLVTNEEEIPVSSSTNVLKQDFFEGSSDTYLTNSEEQAQNGYISLDPETSFKENDLNRKSEEELLPPLKVACSMEQMEPLQSTSFEADTYKDLNQRLEKLALPKQSYQIDEVRVKELEHSDAFLQADLNVQLQNSELKAETVYPSAPIFEEEKSTQEIVQTEMFHSETPKVQCMPLDEAIRLYGGTEIAAVKDMSAREQADVETGPNCGPEHPLVDLLSTFRSSLRAVENERARLASNFDEEENYRASLWKVEKKKIHLRKTCPCGLDVTMQASYEHAELQKDKLPLAKLKLEGLLRDIQECYCHHQHAAMLAHCQIEDLISDIIKSNKVEIRKALSLILQALRVSDGAPEALPAALQRWAEILAGALLDERDLRQLLFLMHHLFRQTRSVQWAARVLSTRVSDSVTAARSLALVDILLSHLQPEVAVECNEESEEGWEEVDERGGAGAVSAGRLRERDLLALLRAFPLRHLLAKILLFSHADYKEATPESWGDASGGSGLLKACCGVRALLAVLRRAAAAHPAYAGLHGELRNVANGALTGLACLYSSPRAPYHRELEVKIAAELEAAFAAGFTLFGTHELHTLPTSLLTEHAARDYCLNFIVGLHDVSPKPVESLAIVPPALTCRQRVRAAAQAAARRPTDHDLARILLDFLLQTGLKRKSTTCKGGCEQMARDCVPMLLAAHPYLHGIALHTVAELSQVSSLDGSWVLALALGRWRPAPGELRAVLADWARRCPALLDQLLPRLDYTPHSGLPLPQQLYIGSFLVQYSRDPARLEASWRALRRLRTHRAHWGPPGAHCLPGAPWPPGAGDQPGPPDEEPTDLFSMAHAILATDWGYSIPLICTVGVSALCTLCATRPREALHCLAPVMMMMAQAPESISLTPKFAELFNLVVSCGPGVVQRALGRGGEPGARLLLRLALAQLDCKLGSSRCALTAWLHALSGVPAALGVLDAGALAARDRAPCDQHADYILQNEPNASEYISNAVRQASAAPLICESLLRQAHHRELSSNLFPALLSVLNEQRRASQRIHVDKALLSLKVGKSAEELIIYKTASAVLVAPFDHPAHVTLWMLFFVMYLSRPPGCDYSTPPCGPLFFSGLIKSRVLSQLKRRLQEAATYHHNEHESYKNTSESIPRNNRIAQSIPADTSLLPALTLADLTGESTDDSNIVETVTDGSTEEAIEVEKRRNNNMAAYHDGAEKLFRQYLHWLEEGDKLAVGPIHADFARFISNQAIEEASERTLSRCRPPPSPEDDFPSEAPPPEPDACRTPLETAVASIQGVACRSDSPRRKLRPRDAMLSDADCGDLRALLAHVERLLKDIETYAQSWSGEVSRLCAQHGRLWELVGALRVPRALPPVARACAHHCAPLTFHLNAQEWCISAGAESGIAECRSASIAGIRRLTRARPQIAQTAAALYAVASRVRTPEHAQAALQRAWASAARVAPCRAAHAAITAFYELLAERWITHDGAACGRLVSLVSQARACSPLQAALCGALVCPRRLPARAWPAVYAAVLAASLPPHVVFSYISRFEMHRWSESADGPQREDIIRALLDAVRRFGPDPAASVLIEIVGVHLSAAARAPELSGVLRAGTGLARRGRLPPALWRHLAAALATHAHLLTLGDIEGALRCMGEEWSPRQPNEEERIAAATHASHVTDTLRILSRALVASAVKLTYEPSRVGGLAWAALSHAWAPWICPASTWICTARDPADDQYSDLVARFCDCVLTVMEDCPGSEARLLQDIFPWSIEMFMMYNVGDSQCSVRMNMMVLLEHIAGLPWDEHQWFSAQSITIALRVLERDEYNDVLRRWCCGRFRRARAATLLGVAGSGAGGGAEGVAGGGARAERLHQLLRLFTCNLHVDDPQLLLEAAKLPWSELHEESLLDGLWGFFQAHSQDTAHMYHEKPQAAVVLSACGLAGPGAARRPTLLAQWTYALQFPKARAQGPHFTRYMLRHLTALEPHLQKPGEAEDLLQRLSCLLYLERSDDAWAGDTLKAWQEWLDGSAPASMLAACVALSAQLTAPAAAAPLAELAIRTYLQHCDGGWAEVVSRWRGAVLEPRVFAERGALRAAYGAAAAAGGPRAAAGLPALEGEHYDFVKNEVMVAVWICYATRVARECDEDPAPDAREPHAEDRTALGRASRALLRACGAAPRRSLLRALALQPGVGPTQRHRALVRFAECVLAVPPSPSTPPSPPPACAPSPAALAFESACAGLDCDVTWARAPTQRRLVRLAVSLYSTHEKYFAWELEHAK